MRLQRSSLPNIITVARIAVTPGVFLLILPESAIYRLLAFLLFLVAAFSDLWDGYLARKHGWISDFGKLWDPIADKLLVVATFIPFWIVSHSDSNLAYLPYWEALPLWVVLVIFGREILITVVRSVLASRGRVVPAGSAGKHKAVWQNIFIGSAIFWYAMVVAAERYGWTSGVYEIFRAFIELVVGLSLLVAVTLTVYSMVVYLYEWWKVGRATP
ncbi:MAG TPA: CDP-diacylglycerol--glycerol-3-phosphate 3-phosphatidyltransferase [Longimicrobiales bacterium]|nr:CDP-diacylglycerol--glycerol-3-phosphate 3-phosphatidyltransferase [Longimicrobiales bacterium]